MAVGAFERTNEGAVFRPALPVLIFLFSAFGFGLVVTHARRIFENASHFACSLERGPKTQNRRVAAAPYRVFLSNQSGGEDNGPTGPKGAEWQSFQREEHGVSS